MNGRAITRPTACLPVRISRAIAAAVVELLERDRLLVRGDLEDGVGGRVDDPLARLLVLLAELLDDLRPRRGLVAEHAAAGPVHERVDHVVREAVRVGRERRRRDDAHQLPVARRRVLALRALEQPAGDRRRARLRRAALERLDVAEAERLEVRAGRGRRRRGRRCRACSSPRPRSRPRPAALPRRRHRARSRTPAACAAILRRAWTRPRPHRARRSTSSRSSRLAAAVTWLVVKISARRRQPRTAARGRATAAERL